MRLLAFGSFDDVFSLVTDSFFGVAAFAPADRPLTRGQMSDEGFSGWQRVQQRSIVFLLQRPRAPFFLIFFIFIVGDSLRSFAVGRQKWVGSVRGRCETWPTRSSSCRTGASVDRLPNLCLPRHDDDL